MLLSRTIRTVVPNLMPTSVAGYRTRTAYPHLSHEGVTTNNDKSIIVAWHPVKDHPYEFTRPLLHYDSMGAGDPLSCYASSSTEAIQISDKLKVNKIADVDRLFHHKHERLRRRDLMRLTWTTKHRWFINNDYRKRIGRNLPRERPYL